VKIKLLIFGVQITAGKSDKYKTLLMTTANAMQKRGL
jgi:hypothetical protein